VADAEAQRDDLVRVPAGDEGEDLALALGQLDDRLAIAAGRQQLARRARVQRRVAGGGRADGAQQLVGLGVLEQVADRAGLERLEDPRPVAETTSARRSARSGSRRRSAGSRRRRRGRASRGR
jgi:hypothetical protein